MDGLTYQQVLADHYEETGKNVLVHHNEYSEEVPPEDKHPDELESQEDFQKFSPRHAPEYHEPPVKQDDKTKFSVVYDKQTQVRLINIDSRFRNYGNVSLPNTIPATGDAITDYFTSKVNEETAKARALYNQSSATNYVFKLKDPIKNVISVRLSSIEIPNSFYAFSRARGNVLFSICYPAASLGLGNAPVILEIPSGNWDQSPYPLEYSTTQLNPNNTVPPPSPLILPPYARTTGFPFDINSKEQFITSHSTILWKLAFVINNYFMKQSEAPYNNPAYQIGPTNWFECNYVDASNGKIYLGCNNRVEFDVNWVVDPSATSANYVDLNTDYPQNLDTVIARSGTTVADFGLGYNLGFRSTSYNSINLPPSLQKIQNSGKSVLNLKRIWAEGILNTIDTNYVFLTLDPDWKVIEEETPDRTQLFAFGKIVIDVPKFAVNYDNASNGLTKEYFLKQPTNIHSIPVRLSDPYDQDIDLNGMDFSFTLELREVLHSGLYETMRS